MKKHISGNTAINIIVKIFKKEPNVKVCWNIADNGKYEFFEETQLWSLIIFLFLEFNWNEKFVEFSVLLNVKFLKAVIKNIMK